MVIPSIPDAPLMIFVVTFAGTAYAAFSIRKDNPIDAIRMENT